MVATGVTCYSLHTFGLFLALRCSAFPCHGVPVEHLGVCCLPLGSDPPVGHFHTKRPLFSANNHMNP